MKLVLLSITAVILLSVVKAHAQSLQEARGRTKPIKKLCGNDFINAMKQHCYQQSRVIRTVKICCKYENSGPCKRIEPPETWGYICEQSTFDRIQDDCCERGCSLMALLKACTGGKYALL